MHPPIPEEGNQAPTFAADPGVVAVVGHLNSGCSIPASKIYHDAGLAMITPISTSDVASPPRSAAVLACSLRMEDVGLLDPELPFKNGCDQRFIEVGCSQRLFERRNKLFIGEMTDGQKISDT